MPRGLSFRDVTAFGLCNGVASGTAFQFNAQAARSDTS
jgi:hypothetical protein